MASSLAGRQSTEPVPDGIVQDTARQSARNLGHDARCAERDPSVRTRGSLAGFPKETGEEEPSEDGIDDRVDQEDDREDTQHSGVMFCQCCYGIYVPLVVLTYLFWRSLGEVPS